MWIKTMKNNQINNFSKHSKWKIQMIKTNIKTNNEIVNKNINFFKHKSR